MPGDTLVDGKTGKTVVNTPTGVPVITGSAPTASGITTGSVGKVFKPIDLAQSGIYADGLWSFAYQPQSPGKGHGILKYDGKVLPNPASGDSIQTPWGWMQWQNGTWLPVAEKPAKGKQLPDPGKK